MVCVDPNDIPAIAIVDAELMYTLPKGLTASTGLDARTHAIEGLITKGAWEMSDMFEISLDKLLKEDKQMVKTIDKERLYGKYYKHKQSIIDFLTGAGTGLVISCCISPDSIRRTVILCIGIAMFLIGGVKKLRWDKEVVKYLEK